MATATFGHARPPARRRCLALFAAGAAAAAAWGPEGRPLSEKFGAYRLRLAHGSSPPFSDLFAADGGQAPWVVDDVSFHPDEGCRTAPLPVARTLGSVGHALGTPALAHDGQDATSWNASCVAGIDAHNRCLESWEHGAWIGAELAAPAPVLCARLAHSGAPAGLALEALDAAAGVWRGLQDFGPVPAARAGSRVLLRRLRGGTCDAPLAAPPAALEPTVAASQGSPALLATWAAGDQVWLDRPGATWADLGGFVPASLSFRLRASAGDGGAAYEVEAPGEGLLRVFVLSRGGVAEAPPLAAAEGWEEGCEGRTLPSIDDDGEVARYSFCAARTLREGQRAQIPAPAAAGATVEVFLGEVQALWMPSCLARTQWRFRALDATASWAVHELEFYRDLDCLEPVPDSVPLSPGGDPPSEARAVADGSLATAWVSMCAAPMSPTSPCSAGKLWAGKSYPQAEDVGCMRVFQAMQVQLGETGLSTNGRFHLEVWDGGAWEFHAFLDDLENDGWAVWANSSGWHRWRLVNADDIPEAWAVHEMALLSDTACTEPVAGGQPVSSDGPGRQFTETSKAFDGDDSTVWVSECAPCAAGRAFLGLAFRASKMVRCVSLRQAADPSYWPGAVRLQYWSTVDGVPGWTLLRTFSGLQGGLQHLTPYWGAPGSRFAIRNDARAKGGWRVAEVRFFGDPDCLSRMRGLALSSDGDTADAASAFDDDPGTFYFANCCAGWRFPEPPCTGCEDGEAFLGMNFLTNETEVQCLQMLHAGVAQLRGPPMFSSESVSLLRWNGFDFDHVYTWHYLPASEWVLLGVGRERAALGSGMGCNDIQGWEACLTRGNNASGGSGDANASSASSIAGLDALALWNANGSEEFMLNCSTYAAFQLCNETFQDDSDCGGMPMRLACRRSCCLCGEEGNPPECRSGGAAVDELPPWLLPLVGAAGASLVVGLQLGGFLWYRRTCHRRKGCRKCCRTLDNCVGRDSEPF